MSDRFFVELPISGDSAVLTGQEAVHLARVLRARVGDVVMLFDGSGMEFSARISEIKKEAVHCTILDRWRGGRELIRRIAFGVALPKGDRQRFLVEKLTELGAASLTPLITERSIVQPDEQTVVRLRRAVIEASKQCGRNRLMTITSPCRLAEFLAATESGGLRVIAHPGRSDLECERRPRESWEGESWEGEAWEGEAWEGEAPAEPDLRENCGSLAASPSHRRPGNWLSLLDLSQRLTHDLTCAVGPEGGFTDDELKLAASAGWLQLDLGPRTLRVETAAIALAAIAGMSC